MGLLLSVPLASNPTAPLPCSVPMPYSEPESTFYTWIPLASCSDHHGPQSPKGKPKIVPTDLDRRALFTFFSLFSSDDAEERDVLNRRERRKLVTNDDAGRTSFCHGQSLPRYMGVEYTDAALACINGALLCRLSDARSRSKQTSRRAKIGTQRVSAQQHAQPHLLEGVKRLGRGQYPVNRLLILGTRLPNRICCPTDIPVHDFCLSFVAFHNSFHTFSALRPPNVPTVSFSRRHICLKQCPESRSCLFGEMPWNPLLNKHTVLHNSHLIEMHD